MIKDIDKKSLNLLESLSFCVFDLETTGGNHDDDKIIEIGLVKIEKLKVTQKKDFLINPQIPIPDFIQKLTSIKQKDVEKAPQIEEVIDEILEFMGESILVAHNISFDIPFFNSELRRLGKKELKNPSICTNMMTKNLIPQLLNSNLFYMSKLFNIKHQSVHRALDDALATAHLLVTYLHIFLDKKISKVNHLYYPKNKFELDRAHFSPEDKQWLIQKIKKSQIPFLISVKGENGVLLYSYPCMATNEEEKKFLIDKINELQWSLVTLKLHGPFLETLIHSLKYLPKHSVEIHQESHEREWIQDTFLTTLSYCLSIEDLNIFCDTYTRDWDFCKSLHIVHSDEVKSLSLDPASSLMIPALEEGDHPYFSFLIQFEKDLEECDKNEISLVLEFVEVISYKLNDILKRSTFQEFLHFSRDFISDFKIPIVLLNAEGEILISNKEFSDLNILPRKLLDTKNDSEIEVSQGVYKVLNTTLSEERQLYILIESSSLVEYTYKETYNDIEIILNSLAHEINNPLSGILASVSLLELEDLSEDNLSMMKEIKSSALRCKELIDIFLGLGSNIQLKTQNIKDSIAKALELLRFRLFESNISFNMEYFEVEKFEKFLNFSHSTLAFYLIFSDILTYQSRKRLTDEDASQKVVIKIYENKEFISLETNIVLSEFKNNINKLLAALLTINQLELVISKNELKLSEK